MELEERKQNQNVLTIGKTLSILISNDTANLLPKNPSSIQQPEVQLALNSLKYHLSKQSNLSNVFSAICPPLFEKIIESKDNKQRNRVFQIFIFIFHQNNEIQNTLIQTLKEYLNNKENNKKWKLGATLTIYKILQSIKNEISNSISNKSKNKVEEIKEIKQIEEIEEIGDLNSNSKETTINEYSSNISSFQELIEPLLFIIKNDSVKEGTKLERKATRLTVAASDTILSIIHCYALFLSIFDSVPKSGEIGQLLWRNGNSILELLNEVIYWNKEHRYLYAVTVSHIRDILISVFSPYQDILIPVHQQVLGIQLLSYLFTLFAPYIMEGEESPLKHLHEQVQFFISRLKQNEENADSIFCLSLIFGKLIPKDFKKAVEKYKSQLLEPSLLSLINSKDIHIQSIVVHLLRKILVLISKEDNIETLIAPLHSLLSSRDEASKAVVSLIAEFTILYPNKLLDQVLSNLDSNEKIERINSLEIVGEISNLIKENANETSNQSLRFLKEKIASKLVERLYDDEISLRIQASSLFSMLDAEFIIPKLLRMCYHRDARVRSAADSSLLNLLCNRNDVENSICCLLDSIKQIPASLPVSRAQSPADIGSNSNLGSPPSSIETPAQITITVTSENISKIDEDADRIMRLIPKWAEKLPDYIWPELIKRMIDKCMNSPEDGIIIKFLSSISLYLGKQSSLVLQLVILRMKFQPSLTEDILTSDSKESAVIIQSLIFERIRPLLLLRILPISSFKLSSISLDQLDSLSTLLLERIVASTEFEEVRKLSAEALAKIPTYHSFSIITNSLNNAAASSDFILCKYFLFSLCSHFAFNESEILSLEEKGDVRVEKVILLLFNAFELSAESQNIQKYQLGCIDCIAILLKIQLTYNPPVTININNKNNYYAISSMLDLLINKILQKDSPISVRLGIVNAFIVVVKMLGEVALEKYSKLVIPSLCKFANSETTENSLKAACLQVLFTNTFYMKSKLNDFAKDMLNLSISLLQHKDASVRMNSLKLMGAIMADLGDIVFSNESATVLRVQSHLTSLANLDSSHEVRTLAEKFLNVLNEKL